MLFETLALCIRTQVQVLASAVLPILMRQQEKIALVLGPLPPIWEGRMEFLVPGISLSLSWTLEGFGGVNQGIGLYDFGRMSNFTKLHSVLSTGLFLKEPGRRMMSDAFGSLENGK